MDFGLKDNAISHRLRIQQEMTLEQSESRQKTRRELIVRRSMSKSEVSSTILRDLQLAPSLQRTAR